MAVISDLVRVVAEVEGLEENFVSVYARAAREAGYISHHGRGRNAARMTARDAACLLIAVNASTLAKNVPATIAEYSRLITKHDQEHGLGEQLGSYLAREGVLFINALSFLLSCDDQGRLQADQMLEKVRDTDFTQLAPHLRSNLQVEFEGPQPRARIKVTSMKSSSIGRSPAFVKNADLWYFADHTIGSEIRVGDRTQTTTIRTNTIIAVAQVLQT